jgi:aminopeptidase N
MNQKTGLFKIIFYFIVITFSATGCSPAVQSGYIQTDKNQQVEQNIPTQEIVVDKEAFIFNAENASAGDAYIPEIGNRGYDVQQYNLNITLDPGTYWVEGTMDVDLLITQDNLRQISFDLVGLSVNDVEVDNAPADQFFSLNKKLYVDFTEPVENGSSHTISIQYAGQPVQEPSAYVPFIDYLGIQFREEMLYIVSEPDGARYWMPVNDHPLDKASYHMEITVPEQYVAASNGKLINTIEASDRTTFTWVNPEPLASGLVTIAVGKYERIESVSPDGIILRSYVTNESTTALEDMQPIIGEMIDWMSDLFGPYPFEEFGYVEVSDIGASLETQTMVIMSESALLDEGVLCHEMSHMWFGDWVSLNSWSEIWRNEGFATYVSLMWQYRNDEQGLDIYMEQLQENINSQPNNFPLNNPPSEEMFGRDSYYKGAVLAHALRKEVGDEAFFSGLKTYFNQYGGSTASDAEFQAIMEEASGRSLNDFFKNWFE